MTNKKPTATNRRGNKIFLDGFQFDSQKEADFYERFIKNCKLPFEVHPEFVIEEKQNIVGEVNVSGIKYTPDFLVKDFDGNWLHVYDVKNDLSIYGLTTGDKLRFKLFALKYKFPVEAVRVYKNYFRTIAVGVTKPRNAKSALECTSVHYHWKKATKY